MCMHTPDSYFLFCIFGSERRPQREKICSTLPSLVQQMARSLAEYKVVQREILALHVGTRTFD